MERINTLMSKTSARNNRNKMFHIIKTYESTTTKINNELYFTSSSPTVAHKQRIGFWQSYHGFRSVCKTFYRGLSRQCTLAMHTINAYFLTSNKRQSVFIMGHSQKYYCLPLQCTTFILSDKYDKSLRVFRIRSVKECEKVMNENVDSKIERYAKCLWSVGQASATAFITSVIYLISNIFVKDRRKNDFRSSSTVM